MKAAGGLRAQDARGLPGATRLLKHADFERVYKHGERHFGRHMTIFFLARESGDRARIGFTVSRALGGAVQRNRIRRRLREAARLRGAELRASADVVINPKRSVLQAEFEELALEMARGFRVVNTKLSAAAERGTPRAEKREK
jgi:ribonuclease P protein component